MSWYINYFNKIDLNENIDSFVILLKKNININIENEDIIENKLNQIESEYDTKLLQLNKDCIDLNIFEELKNKKSLIILQKEVEIIKLLTKYALQNNQLDYDFFLKSIKFLFQLSEILRIRLKQNEIIHENKILNPSNLPRCSYKFCNYKDTCNYNYNINSKNQCYQDHYVHRMVSADLTILIEYIEQQTKLNDNLLDNKNQNVIHNKEILKTINTLSFVINHMENELKAKCLYLDEAEWESCHFVKNP